MHTTVELLARLQFAFTIMFHYLFPPLTIGLGTLLVIMEGLYLKTKNPIYESMCKFWVKIFALNFSLGVATGIVMEFEFGTNWATYSRYVGDIFGSALAAEGIFAFFLESGFLAVLLFGWDKVSPKMHFFSTLMVTAGATMSAFWICVANSWMQTPAGFEIVGTGMSAKAVVTDFWAMIFNPSSVMRFLHVINGAWLVGAFFVMSVSAYYIIKGRHLDFAKRSFTIALITASLAAPLQGFLGSKQAELVHEYQPAKLAAYEGEFQSGGNQPFYIIGIPDEKTGTVKYAVKVPGLVSFLATGKWDGFVVGLNDIPKENRPPVLIPFIAYHGMIGLGMYMLAISWLGVFLLWRGKLFNNKWVLRIFVVSVAAPYIANQLGWIGTEVGRQPWVVQGLLRTSEALSHAVKANQIVSSLVLFIIIYGLLLLFFFYTLDRKIKRGPDVDHHTLTKDKKKFQPNPLKELQRDRLDPQRHDEGDEKGGDHV